MDGINARIGRNTIVLAAQGCGARSFDTKRSQKSPAWTTRIASEARAVMGSKDRSFACHSAPSRDRLGCIDRVTS
ncbi:DUF4113 domain-containing protein [Novosphingobium sp. MBES04]|uniref:DUF4113 domain-containing protein n=1 Tax=Novosphingobium sp. MBES04 TaxID=1206458 RepID=UPI004040B55D